MTKTVDTPAIGISYQVGVSENRQVVFQCFVPFDAPVVELNGALDKLRDAADRQEAFINLPKVRARLAQFLKVQERAVEDMARLDAERIEAAEARHRANGDRRTDRPNAQQQAHDAKNAADRANAETTMKRGQAEIDAMRVEIAELEAKVV